MAETAGKGAPDGDPRREMPERKVNLKVDRFYGAFAAKREHTRSYFRVSPAVERDLAQKGCGLDVPISAETRRCPQERREQA